MLLRLVSLADIAGSPTNAWQWWVGKACHGHGECGFSNSRHAQ